MNKEKLGTVLSRTFLDNMSVLVSNAVKEKNYSIVKKSLLFSDAEKLREKGVELNDSLQIIDDGIYVEYELARVSQRIFEEPIANFPFLDIFYVDSEGADRESIVYKLYGSRGEMGGSVDKGTPKHIVSFNAKAEAYLKHTLDAYSQDYSLYELAVSISNGADIQGRILKAMWLSYVKAIHTCVFTGVDISTTLSFKYALKSITGASSEAAAATFAANIAASTSTKIYADVLKVVNAMDAKGEGNEMYFTPNVMLVSPTAKSQMKALMENAGYFNDTVLSYLERNLDLQIVAYSGCKGAGAGGTDIAILLNTNEQNMFIGIPNPLELYSDIKFNTTSLKAEARSTGLVMINSGAVGYLTGV